eukprot:6213828-Pleurochrysis_carterae.AAC.1
MRSDRVSCSSAHVSRERQPLKTENTVTRLSHETISVVAMNAPQYTAVDPDSYPFGYVQIRLSGYS